MLQGGSLGSPPVSVPLTELWGSPGMSNGGQACFTVFGLQWLLRSQALSWLHEDPGFKARICGSRTVSLPSCPSLQLAGCATGLYLQAVRHILTLIPILSRGIGLGSLGGLWRWERWFPVLGL